MYNENGSIFTPSFIERKNIEADPLIRGPEGLKVKIKY